MSPSNSRPGGVLKIEREVKSDVAQQKLWRVGLNLVLFSTRRQKYFLMHPFCDGVHQEIDFCPFLLIVPSQNKTEKKFKMIKEES